LVEALVVAEALLVGSAVRAEVVVRIIMVQLVVELELLDLPDRVIMVEVVATEMVTVLGPQAEVLAAAEAGVLLMVDKDKVMVQLLALVVPA
jgi:hypothetical protein